MKTEDLVRTCAEAWCEDDIHKVIKLYTCPNELLINKSKLLTPYSQEFSAYYNQQTHLQELYEAYLDICKDTTCYFYDFPYIGDDHVVSSWALYDNHLSASDAKPILCGTNYCNIFEGKVISSVTYHEDPQENKVTRQQALELCIKQLTQEKYLKSKAPDEYLEKYAKKFIQQFEAEKWYMNNNISIDFISERLGLSRVYLSQMLNLKINKRFHDLINEYRINEALNIMAGIDSYSSSRIIDIAMHVGYNSIPCFYRAFKKQTGTTPAAYYKAIFSSKAGTV